MDCFKFLRSKPRTVTMRVEQVNVYSYDVVVQTKSGNFRRKFSGHPTIRVRGGVIAVFDIYAEDRDWIHQDCLLFMASFSPAQGDCWSMAKHIVGVKDEVVFD